MMAYLRSRYHQLQRGFRYACGIESSSDIVFAPTFKSEGEGVDVVATPAENKLELTTRVTPTTLPYLETTADRAIQICIRF